MSSTMAYSPLPPPTAENPSYPVPRPFTASAKESFMDDFNHSHPNYPREIGPPPRKNIAIAALLFVWKTLVLPAMAVAYLAFCYICHYRIVRIGGGTVDAMAHLSVIKAGVTSISILYVSTSLLPLYSLISDLKSEEFFRVLSVKRAGVPLNSVNSISTPSYGFRDSLVTLIRQHGSIYFTGAFFAGLVALATSALAPAALSVGTVLFDGDLVALSVGALERNSVVNMTDFTSLAITGPSSTARDKNSQAGAVAWAEHSLGVNYSFQSPRVGQTTFIVPTPQKLTTDMNARWLSDVIAIQPVCEWIAPDFPSIPGGLNFSSPSLGGNFTVNLTSKHAQAVMSTIDFDHTQPRLTPMKSAWSGGIGGSGAPDSIMDLKTMDDITNGVVVFSFIQCAVGCTAFEVPINVTLSSDMHTSRLTSTTGRAIDVSFLYCDPHAEIQTRHVTNGGLGALSVGDKSSTVQGNLHPVETSLLLSYALMNLDSAGPEMPSNLTNLGHQVLSSMVLGNPDIQQTQVPMQTLDHITEAYASILQSAVKPFLDGSLASAYVPARATRELAVFSSSPPHYIASSVLYLLLTLFVLLCHFRRHAAQFTFFAVAARLARSDIPPLFAEMKGTEKAAPVAAVGEEAAVSSLKTARVILEDGDVLRLRKNFS